VLLRADLKVPLTTGRSPTKRGWSCSTTEEAFWTEIMSRVATLSTRERQVLDGVVTGLSNKAIASDNGLSAQAVDANRANIMRKMRAGTCLTSSDFPNQ